MNTAIAILLKKIALMLAKDKRFWVGVGSVFVGITFFVVLFFGVLFSMISGISQTENDLYKYIFFPDLPIVGYGPDSDIYNHIVFAREELAPVIIEIDTLNKQQQDYEDDEENKHKVDILKAQVIYYVLFLYEEITTLKDTEPKPEEEKETTEVVVYPAPYDYAMCFFTILHDDEIQFLSEEKDIHSNIEALIGRPITAEERKKIEEIYNALTSDTAMLIVDGEYGPPVEPQYMQSITSHFGTRKGPITGKPGAFHNGTDFAWGGCNGANIYAVADGTVTRASDVSDGFGKCVVIDHGGGILTYYAHCSSISVSVGQEIKKGQHISNIGTTGRSTGPHLHFGLKINGNWQEPLSLYK